MSIEHVFDLLPAYVIGCLDTDERQVVDIHLDQCECCQVGLHAYRRVLEDLPLRIALSEPPPEIREQILERARQEGKLYKRFSASDRKGFGPRTVALVWFTLNLAFMVISMVVNLTLWRRLSIIEERSA